MESVRDSETVEDSSKDSSLEDMEARDTETRKRLVKMTTELCEWATALRNSWTRWDEIEKR